MLAHNAHMQASCIGCMARVRSAQQARRAVAIGFLAMLLRTLSVTDGRQQGIADSLDLIGAASC